VAKVELRPQPALQSSDNSTLRYPEVLHAYHLGRYVDPNDGLVMHEQHVVYRVEEISRWDLHPAAGGNYYPAFPPLDAAFSPAPVNDAVLAEVNSQRLATSQIMGQGKRLASSLQQLEKALQDSKTNQEMTVRLRSVVEDLRKRLAALEAAQVSTPTNLPPTNAPTGFDQ
jgi:hypothetical protein